MMAAELQLPALPAPKVRRHLTRCAVFDQSPGPCDCGSPPKVYDALELESFARRAVEADRADRDVPAVPPFADGSWQHAVDDELVNYGRTSEEFTTPHKAVQWLITQTIECARTIGVKEVPRG